MCDTPAVKVLFITQKKDAPSTKWRLLQFVPHLAVATEDEHAHQG